MEREEDWEEGKSWDVNAYLVVVLHDGALELGCINPGDEVFHVPGQRWNQGQKLNLGEERDIPSDQERWVSDCIGANTNVPLLNKFDSLTSPSTVRISPTLNIAANTHRANSLRHLQLRHDHAQASPTKCSDSQFILHIGELRLEVQYTHIVEFR